MQAAHLGYLKLRRELAYKESRADGRAARIRKEGERHIHRIYKNQHRQDTGRDET